MTNRLVSSLAVCTLLSACPSAPATAPVPAAAPAASAASKAPAPKLPPMPQIPPPADVAAAPAGAQKLPDGVAWEVLTPGTGKDHAGDNDTVKVKFTVWTTDGKMFDTSEGKPQIPEFPLTRAAVGWKESIQQLVVGGKARFWIPSELAFKGKGGPQGTNVLEIELLEIKPAPPVPSDVAAPPADATKLPDGLAVHMLKPGTGAKPTANDIVQLNYTGWTTTGRFLDSSRGTPISSPLGHLIKGWQEGIALMTEGETARMWIPGELANPNPKAPKDTLVFDIELVKIGAPAAAKPATP